MKNKGGKEKNQKQEHPKKKKTFKTSKVQQCQI